MTNESADDSPSVVDDRPEATSVSTDDVRHESGAAMTPEQADTAAPRRLSISVRALLVGGLVTVLVIALGVMTWLYLDARASVQAQQRKSGDDRRAEQIAMDYAVGAATMNYQDLNSWKGRLVKGTTDNLKDKLTKAATSMEQILVPLEWNSTAKPLAAKVRSDTDGTFVVDTFVSVLTKTTQAPDTLPSTATYSISIDSHNNWAISDVGGIGAVVGSK